jgi:hypothetical protein
MTLRRTVGPALLLAVAACGGKPPAKAAAASGGIDTLPPDVRDATILGRELYELIDRAVEYKGAHRGQPPSSFRQMGIDTLAPLLVRRIATVSDSSVITVQFRQPRGRRVASCEANPSILEEAALGGGKFSLVCSTASGSVARYEVTAK